MTKEEFKKILKSTAFKSTNRLEQTHILQFTEVHMFKDGNYLCDYDLKQRESDFLMTFDNFQKKVLTDDFVNVLVKYDNIEQFVNMDSSFNGTFNVVLEGRSMDMRPKHNNQSR